MHGSRAEATEEDEGEAVSAVLNEIAHVFKGGFSKVAKSRASVMAAALILSPSSSLSGSASVELFVVPNSVDIRVSACRGKNEKVHKCDIH